MGARGGRRPRYAPPHVPAPVAESVRMLGAAAPTVRFPRAEGTRARGVLETGMPGAAPGHPPRDFTPTSRRPLMKAPTVAAPHS